MGAAARTEAGRQRPGMPAGHERGMVTVETAFATLALAGVAAVGISLAGLGFVLGQLQVSANEVARQAARHDEAAVARARADVPAGGRVELRREGGEVIVEASAQVSVGPATFPLTASATVLEER